MEIKPKSRTKKQTKSLASCNYHLAKMGKQVVQDVLNKFSYLNKKEHETFAERKRLQRKVETDEEKEERYRQRKRYKQATKDWKQELIDKSSLTYI